MATWKDVLRRVQERQDKSNKWKSNAKNLMNIIQKAEAWGLDPAPASRASISNLQEIIPSARKAIRNAEKERLDELFRLADKLTIKELRIKLRGDRRDKVLVRIAKTTLGPMYEFSLPQEQDERLKRATELMFDFQEDQESIR